MIKLLFQNFTIMVFGISDLVLLILLVGWNTLFLRKSKCNLTLGCGMFLLFGILLPVASVCLEIKKVTKNWKADEIHDNFELLYVYLKFPIYWTIGIVQSALILFQKGKIEEKNDVFLDKK